MSTTTTRNGATDYTQDVGEKTTTTTKGGVDKSVGWRKAVETPDLINTTTQTRESADFASIGARISFSIKIVGRFTGTPCP